MFELQRKTIFRPLRLTRISTQNLAHLSLYCYFSTHSPNIAQKRSFLSSTHPLQSVCAFSTFRFEPKRTQIHFFRQQKVKLLHRRYLRLRPITLPPYSGVADLLSYITPKYAGLIYYHYHVHLWPQRWADRLSSYIFISNTHPHSST